MAVPDRLKDQIDSSFQLLLDNVLDRYNRGSVRVYGLLDIELMLSVIVSTVLG